MEFRRLPGTDLNVSRLCMGTMTFGAQADLAESQRMVDCCLEEDVNFFDTANIYHQGASEEVLGKALGARRKDVVVASKVRGAMGDEYSGLSRSAVRRAIEDSLRRLNTDYLDIYYLHQPDYDTPIEETLDVLEELRREGKIRYAGTSNYAAWQICEILWICQKKGYPPPMITQPMYNLLARGIEQEYLPFIKRFGLCSICYNPLAGGLLTGKQKRSQGPLPGTRFDGNEMYLNRYWRDQYFDAVEALQQTAEKCGRSLLEMAFAWLMHREGVDGILLGASRMEQLEENLRAARQPPLEPWVLEECDQVWQRLRGVTPVYNR